MKEFYSTDSNGFVSWIREQWGIEYHSTCEDVDIQGSPERSIARAVFKDQKNKRFLIEAFDKKKYELRLNVAVAVNYLNQKGLKQAVSYMQTADGSFLPFFKDRCYQISDYIDSTGVKQPDYLGSAIMGDSFASFIIKMAHAARGIESEINSDPFSLKAYIYQLFRQMKKHDPQIYDDFSPVLDFLEKEFMDVHDQLPVSFCHGDLHPLNVIWDHEIALAVIDWEFTGMKPDIYDLANLIGCAGIEDPNGLGMPMVMTCINRLKETGIFSPMGWQYLPEYMLALRFGWLSEWLRKDDTQMVEMENAYMTLLMNNIEIIKLGWGL